MLLESTSAPAEIVIETGPVVQTLSEITKNKHADLLVIGRHHESGILGRLRDTAYAIIRESAVSGHQYLTATAARPVSHSNRKHCSAPHDVILKRVKGAIRI